MRSIGIAFSATFQPRKFIVAYLTGFRPLMQPVFLEGNAAAIADILAQIQNTHFGDRAPLVLPADMLVERCESVAVFVSDGSERDLWEVLQLADAAGKFTYLYFSEHVTNIFASLPTQAYSKRRL